MNVAALRHVRRRRDAVPRRLRLTERGGSVEVRRTAVLQLARPARSTLPTVYERALERIRIMDTSGL